MLNFLSAKSSKFKFKNLKTYSSTEWIFDNNKTYRNVFDRYEVDYIYAEFSFYNKQFDVKNWSLKFNLKCFFEESDGSSTLICDLNFDRTVDKEDPVVYIREGWGNKDKGAFWKEGTYCWEVSLEGKKVATDFFHIYETGKEYVSPSSYINIKSIQLYECGSDKYIAENAIAYKVFSSENTRYVGVVVLLNNLLPNKTWFCEIRMRIYNQQRSLKGESMVIYSVEKEAKIIKSFLYWGADELGSWLKGAYTIELSFLGDLIAVVPFDVATLSEAGEVKALITAPYQANSTEGLTSDSLAALSIKSNQSILIQKLAASETDIVIKELLSFAEKKGLEAVTKRVVNLSARWNRLRGRNATEVEKEGFDQINEALIDLIYELEL